jgi:arylsulfatase A-like enzyme
MSTKINAVRTLAALAAAACMATVQAQPSAGAQAGSRRPNILLVIADDIGMDVSTDLYPGLIDGLLEQYGPQGHNHPEYRSIEGKPASLPNLNRLASQGMRFTNVWAQPFCSPTRATILTGLYAAENKVTTYEDALSASHTSFVSQLRDAGYRTGLFGKWHLAGIGRYTGMHPKQAGFDVFKGNMGAALNTFWDYEYVIQDADTGPMELRPESPPERALPGIAATTYAPVVKIADAIDWITAKENENADQPWFAWVAFNLSHATSSRTPSQMIVPNEDTLDPIARAEMQACAKNGFGTADLGDCSGEAVMRAMTTSLDTVLGRLIDAVDALDSNTYVIYVGDNGTPMYGRPGLDFIDNMYITRTARGKGTAYEGGSLVPMFVRGPGIEANSESHEYAHTADLFSTALEIAGLPVPEMVSNSEGNGSVPLDGVSLTPILFGDAAAVRDSDEGFVLTESHNLMTGGTQQVGARNGSFKLICGGALNGETDGDCEFYDIVGDPLEQYPLDSPADDCLAYTEKRLTPYDNDWHYCRLAEVIATRSFLR